MLQYINIDILNRCVKAIKKYPEHAVDISSSFSSSQILSKRIIVDDIEKMGPKKISILAGWMSVGYGLLFKRPMDVTSIDIDPTCEKVGSYICPMYHYITSNISTYTPNADIVINTSIEHIDPPTLKSSLSNIPTGCLCYFQTNNMSWIEDHDYCSPNKEHFIERIGAAFDVIWVHELPIEKKYYTGTRFTLKCVKK